MNHVSIENGFVKILYKLNKDSTHSIVDGRKMDLKRVCNKYPPLNSFSPISESIFMCMHNICVCRAVQYKN